jgi:hypothetical protein
VVEVGPIILFSNLGDGSRDDITAAPFRDPILSPWLIGRRCFHFARTSRGDYDPVCLALPAGENSRTLAPVVKFDHEAILCGLPSVASEVISESFLDLIEEYA